MAAEFDWNITEKQRKRIKELGIGYDEGLELRDVSSPKSPDGLLSKYHREATLRLGGGRVRVFKTERGYFFEGKDTYISEENIAKFAPNLLEELKVLV